MESDRKRHRTSTESDDSVKSSIITSETTGSLYLLRVDCLVAAMEVEVIDQSDQRLRDILDQITLDQFAAKDSVAYDELKSLLEDIGSASWLILL